MKSLVLSLMMYILAGNLECSDVLPCSPAEEGHEYALQCKGHGEHETVFWTVSNSSDENMVISLCNSEGESNNTCEDFAPHVCAASIQAKGNIFFSQLTFPRISFADDDLVFKCIVRDRYFEETYTVFSCRMNLYLLPDMPICQADLIQNRGVRVRCTAYNVYPDIQCKFFEKHGKKVTAIDSGMVQYKIHKTGKREPYYAECTAEFFPEGLGDYGYAVNMIPKPDGMYVPKTSSFDVSNVVTILPDTSDANSQNVQVYGTPSNTAVTVSPLQVQGRNQLSTTTPATRDQSGDQLSTTISATRDESRGQLSTTTSATRDESRNQLSTTTSATRDESRNVSNEHSDPDSHSIPFLNLEDLQINRNESQHTNSTRNTSGSSDSLWSILEGETEWVPRFRIFPKVMIEESSGCLDHEGIVSLICKAICFPLQPEFRWIVENSTSVDARQDSEYCTDHLTTYISRYRFRPSKPREIGMVVCRAGVMEKESSTNLHFMDSKELFLITPSDQTPEFRDTSGTTVGDFSEILLGTDVVMLCVAGHWESHKTRSTTVSVQCWNEDHTTLLLDITNECDSVTFTIQGTQHFNNSQCECTVVGDQQCQGAGPLNVTLLITVTPHMNQDLKDDCVRKSTESNKMTNTTCNYYFIAVVGICLLVIITVVVIIIVFCRRRGKCHRRKLFKDSRYQNVNATDVELLKVPMSGDGLNPSRRRSDISGTSWPTTFDVLEEACNINSNYSNSMATTTFSSGPLSQGPCINSSGYLSQDRTDVTYDSPLYEDMSSASDIVRYEPPKDDIMRSRSPQTFGRSVVTSQPHQGLSVKKCINLSDEGTPLMSFNINITNNSNTSNGNSSGEFKETDGPTPTNNAAVTFVSTDKSTDEINEGDHYIMPVSPGEYYTTSAHHDDSSVV